MNNISLDNNIKSPNDSTFSAGNVNMGSMPQSMQGITYNTLPTGIQNKIEDNALTQGYHSFNIYEHPIVMLRNVSLSILGAMGLVHATNWAMQAKKISSTESHIQSFKNTRLAQASNNINDDLAKSRPGKWLSKVFSSISNKLHSVKYPTVVKEAFGAIKTGSISQWDKIGMFSLGKNAEAKNDVLEFLQKVDKDDVEKLAKALKIDPKELQSTIENFTRGKISSVAAYDKIVKIGNIDAASAEILSKIKIQGRNGVLDKILGTKADINLALTKVKMFNKGIPSQGIIAKAIQKSVALFGDAIGGGVVSGKGGLLMGGLLTLTTPFNRLSSAPKGDRIAAFMEEFWGFAIGSYIMSLFIGLWFNKFLGVTEMGMDKKAIEALAKKMGIELDKGLLSECAINYAREFGKMKKANKLLERYRNGECSYEKLKRFAANKLHLSAEKLDSHEKLLQEMTCFTNTRNEKYFNSVKAEINNIYKNGITFNSVVKEGAKNNKGTFATRLSRYLIAKTGKILSFGRYVLPQAGKSNATRRMLRGAGGFGRIILVGFILVEPFRIGFMKLSNLVFGTAKDSELIQRKKEKAEKKANKAKRKAEKTKQAIEQKQVQEKQRQELIAQQQKMLNDYYQKQQELQQTTLNNPNLPNSQTTIKTETTIAPIEKSMQSNLLSNEQNAEIAATKLGLNNQNIIQARRYIPSAAPAQIKADNQPDPTINSAIVKADKAERYVNKFLSKNI